MEITKEVGKVKKAIREAATMFEYHKEIKEYCEHCRQTKERPGWYSFTSEAIKNESELYHDLSDVLNDNNKDIAYAYSWIVEALEALEELTSDDEDNPDALADVELSEHIDQAVSVYTSELTKWLSSSVYNIYYLTEAVDDGAKENVLMIAQYKAIEEVFNEVREKMIKIIIEKKNAK